MKPFAYQQISVKRKKDRKKCDTRRMRFFKRYLKNTSIINPIRYDD